jgi:hypothetical protein
MSALANRNRNGRRAEHRTTAFLLNHFWLLKQSVDLDGAVFLVRAATQSAEALGDSSSHHPFAVVLARYFEEGAEVEVPKPLVEGPDGHARTEFFVSIHTADRASTSTVYFFSAEEIQSVFRRKKNSDGQEVFVFSITNERNFSQFLRRDRVKVSMICNALAGADRGKNQAYLQQIFEMPGSGSVRPPLVKVAENQWQMRSDDVLFEFEMDEDSIVRGWKCDSAGRKAIIPSFRENPFDELDFDPLNEEWVPRTPRS